MHGKGIRNRQNGLLVRSKPVKSAACRSATGCLAQRTDGALAKLPPDTLYIRNHYCLSDRLLVRAKIDMDIPWQIRYNARCLALKKSCDPETAARSQEASCCRPAAVVLTWLDAQLENFRVHSNTMSVVAP